MPFEVFVAPDREDHGCVLPDIDEVGPGSIFRCDCGRRYERSEYPANSWIPLKRSVPTDSRPPVSLIKK